ncbi:MAG: hypothetical protein AB7H77_03940 [Bdellovibrionales bacterium]
MSNHKPSVGDILSEILEVYRVARFHLSFQRLPEREVLTDYLRVLKPTMENIAAIIDCQVRWHAENEVPHIFPTSEKTVPISLIKHDLLRRNLFPSSKVDISFTLNHLPSSTEIEGRLEIANSPFTHQIDLHLDGTEPVTILGGGPLDYIMLSSAKTLDRHTTELAERAAVLFASRLLHDPDERLQNSAVKWEPAFG